MARMFVRPCRSATIRTRLDADGVRERLSTLEYEPATGVGQLFVSGYLVGDAVGRDDFRFEYHVRGRDNPQDYVVRGTLSDARDWRILRLKVTARAPWITRWQLAFGIPFVAFAVYAVKLSPVQATLFFALGVALHAVTNLFYIPAVVTNRVSSIVASTVSGSVLEDRGWTVPEGS